jgi:signal transduction histidine kinase
MHPAIFISSSVLLGVLFALQEWAGMLVWGYRIPVSLALEAWTVQFLLWGVVSWLLWRWWGPQLQQASVSRIIVQVLPLSVVASVAVEMTWVLCFPNLPHNHPYMPYLRRLSYELSDELLDNMAIFWCAIGLFKGIGYYQKFREKENAAAQLEVQLATAQISALRMQLNPHFLFNAMNSISSLMRTDIDGADTMLEQLGSLLRITLERGDAQLISLRDEMEFIEMYLAMQDKRFVGRVQQSVKVDAELYDALVPTMILQPIVENAYAHGLSKLDSGGILSIEAHRDGDHMRLSVLNTGIGLIADSIKRTASQGVGLANIKGRLQLHYGDDQNVLMSEPDLNRVQVIVTMPLQFSQGPTEQITRFSAL